MPEQVPFRPTSDVCDAHDDDGGPEPQILTERFVSLGGRSEFAGVVSTVKAHEDNSVVKDAIAEPGDGRVLVIDGGGSLRRSMVGGNVAAEAAGNGWAGFVVYALSAPSVYAYRRTMRRRAANAAVSSSS